MPNFKYLIAREQDLKWGLAVTTVGQQTIAPGTPYPSDGHPQRYLFSVEKGRILNEFHIVYISQGRGWFASRHKPKTRIDAGSILFLFPNEWHNYAPDPETGWEESWIGFNGPFADNLLREGFVSPEKPLLQVGISDLVWSLFHRACEVARREEIAFQQELSGIALQLIGSIYAAEKRYGLVDQDALNIIGESKNYMRKYIDSDLQMPQVAKNVGLGYSRFRRLFREYTGMSPALYFSELRVSRCKELLTITELNCQEIAYSLGFQSPSYFNTVFRKKTGMTPFQYRKLTKGENKIPRH